MTKPINIITEISAGGVVYKKVDNQYLFLLGKNSGYHKWVLPKGRIEVGETEIQAALREIEEETSIKGQVVGHQPIHQEQYIYMADFKTRQDPTLNDKQSNRRIKTYQENGGGQTKVKKTVKYFLVKYLSGDPFNHGWEMEDCAWFSLEKALKKTPFAGQKQALEKAFHILNSSS